MPKNNAKGKAKIILSFIITKTLLHIFIMTKRPSSVYSILHSCFQNEFEGMTIKCIYTIKFNIKE